MLTLAGHELLNAWERALAQPGPARVIPLLAAAAGVPGDEVLRWDVARRDAALFELRDSLFGSRAEAVGRCPACAQDLEFEVELRELSPGPRTGSGEVLEAVIDGHRIRYRLPNTADLQAIAALGGQAGARDALLERCIESVLPEPSSRAAVAPRVAELISQSEADAAARLSLVCPVCQHAWAPPFDIAAFLWSEVDEWAWRTLRQVHGLARGYGWREADVLALSPRRRQMYLDLLDE